MLILRPRESLHHVDGGWFSARTVDRNARLRRSIGHAGYDRRPFDRSRTAVIFGAETLSDHDVAVMPEGPYVLPVYEAGAA